MLLVWIMNQLLADDREEDKHCDKTPKSWGFHHATFKFIPAKCHTTIQLLYLPKKIRPNTTFARLNLIFFIGFLPFPLRKELDSRESKFIPAPSTPGRPMNCTLRSHGHNFYKYVFSMRQYVVHNTNILMLVYQQ